jgi:hypothetical protein
MQFHAASFNLLVGYLLVEFNVMLNHIAAIFEWEGESKRFYFSAVTSFVQLGAPFGAIIGAKLGEKYGRR